MNQYNKTPIKDFPGYAIDKDGVVWTCRVRGSTPGTRGGGSSITNVWKPLKQKLNKGALYPTFALCKDGKVYYKRLHRLMAEAFLPNPDNHPLVCHKDGNRSNNTLDNIYWGTSKDNWEDGIKHGSYKYKPGGFGLMKTIKN